MESSCACIEGQLPGLGVILYGIRTTLIALGLNTKTPVGASIEFFFLAAVNISLMLCSMIFIVSYIQSYFPPERTKKIIGKFHGIWANIIAALLGTVTPFCACSSIPLFMGFTSAGLPLGVTFSFLISSPMVDLGSLVMLVGIFGIKIAIVYVLLGLIVAVIGGTLIEKLKMEEYIEDFIRNRKVNIDIEAPNLTQKERFVYAKDQVVDIYKKVYKYIFIGVTLGAIIHNWVPQTVIQNILGSQNPFGVILATLVGVPMYSDIFGAIPIGETLFLKGARLGTILAFMMAVTTLSLPSLIMLRKAIKPKLLYLFTGICTVGIILVGYAFNALQNLLK